MSAANQPMTLMEEIRILRRDDHRLYHQSRVNQTLHLISACMFLVTYVLVWFEPAYAALLGWFGGMCIRQTGHFFFEPQGFDEANHLSNARKEAIKVGFNVYRKIALLTVWVAIPVVLWADPSLFGVLPAEADLDTLVERTGWAWLVLGLSGLAARTTWLMANRSVQTGLAWFLKILTDPFHNVDIYWKSPIHLLKGETIEALAPVDYYTA